MKRILKTTLLAKLASQYCTVILCLVSISFSANAAKVGDCIPRDSFIYLQLQDLDAIYAEIEMSENWGKVLSLLTNASPEVAELNQGMTMALGMFGTDLSGLIETIGYQTGFAMWENGDSNIQAGIVVHSGGNMGELQRFTKIVTGMMGMSAGTLKPDAGEYRKVQYSILELPQQSISYGFVSESLVVGIGEGSFETLIDTYKNRTFSLGKNKEFAKAYKKLGAGQVVGYVNVQQALPLIQELNVGQRRQLAVFETLFVHLNVLEVGHALEIYAQFNPSLSDNEIRLFLKEGTQLRTLNGLSGDEDLFVAAAPVLLEGVWQIVRTELDEKATSETYAFISFLEGMLNLNLEEDVIAGLTGEIALSVSDLMQFDPEALEGLYISFDGAFEIDAAAVETHGGLIFNSRNPLKWNQLGNSVSNLQNASVSQTDYKGTAVSAFASNIYYGNADGLFCLSFSEEQMYALVDGIKQKKKPSYLKQLPKTPTAVVQLNLARLLESTNGAPPADMLLVTSQEISPLLAWVSVKENEAVLEATLSEKETPLEVLAKLAPFIVWSMNNQ